MSDVVSLCERVPDLVAWYSREARRLPWRTDPPDPYGVWISEIMSQQSTLVTVVPYFQRWMARFPTVEALASAHEDEVLAQWAGLGYYSRARNLLKAAQALAHARRERGGWPQSFEDWLELPGVGPYSAAAVTAIAFNGGRLPFDGNVCRVLARYLGVWDPLNDAGQRRMLERELQNLADRVPREQHGRLAQAFMELGALVCRPGTAAKCELCPLAVQCVAKREERVDRTPRAKQRPAPTRVPLLALVYRDPQGAVLLRKIPSGQRLEGQWELPLLSMTEASEQWDERKLCEHFELNPRIVKHSITKYAYEVRAVEAGAWEGPLPDAHAFWAEPQVPPGTLTTLTRKILLI
jgi:A/G-specific adenine glycosylase